MHRHLIITILLLTTLAAAAQGILPQLKRTPVDMEAIRRETYNPSSPYYWPRLYEEYQRNDTLMKLDKYRHLYFGYMLQEDYTPYRAAVRPLTYTLHTPPGEKATRAECDSVIAYADRALADYPFDMRQMMLKINALRESGRTALADIWQYKLNYLLMAIVSTGTGTSTSDPWTVIDPQHEYVLLNMLNYLVSDHEYRPPSREYITVTDADGAPRGAYWFDIEYLLKEYYRKHPEELPEP